MPPGIAYALNIDEGEVQMHSLVPWDTTMSTGYITTLVWAYIPSSMVDTLSMAIHAPKSALYTNPDASISTLMSYINPTISIIPGSETSDNAGTGTSGGTTTTTAATNNGGVFSTDQQNTSSSTKATTAGVAVGAIAAASAYGAAMFFIARRYKRKKNGHRRASSIVNPSEMRYTGSPALMGGGAVMSGGRGSYGTANNGRTSRGSGRTGNSARTAQISAPMMVENSLGWN